jgi:hypothetical protein
LKCRVQSPEPEKASERLARDDDVRLASFDIGSELLVEGALVDEIEVAGVARGVLRFRQRDGRITRLEHRSTHVEDLLRPEKGVVRGLHFERRAKDGVADAQLGGLELGARDLLAC